MSSVKRIQKEFSDIIKSPPNGTRVSLPMDGDLHAWKVLMDGPINSPYAGGVFILNLTLPSTYPFAPPTLSFATKIYHPNITNDDKGSMCLGLLRPDQWKPSTRITEVLTFARQLLMEPMGEDAVEAGIGREFREERRVWEDKARSWTKMYAMGEGKK